MPTTPTDPTKAQVWKTGTPENPKFEFYIPRGAKGEPGGIVLGTVLADGTNLDDIKVDGVYRRNVNPQAGYNYPMISGGILYVHTVASGGAGFIEQRYHPGITTASDVRNFYQRQCNNGVWSAWRAFSSQRVDTTAGRAIYTWDDINGREQLVYGDTGSRNITELFDETKWTINIAKIRRIGGEVELRLALIPLAGNAGTVSVFKTNLPMGFQNQHSFNGAVVDSTNALISYSISYGGGPMTISNVVAGRNITGLIKWQTLNNWPTSLPGTADGQIPNL